MAPLVGITGNVSGPLASQVISYTTAPSYAITPAYYSIFFTAGTDATLTIIVSGNLTTTDVYLSDWGVFVGPVGTSLGGSSCVLQGQITAPTIAANQMSANTLDVQNTLICNGVGRFSNNV